MPSSGHHRTTVLGRLGNEPRLKYFENGTAVCNFPIAVTESWKGKDKEERTRTTWYQVTTRGKRAEICAQYLNKGDMVLVEGTTSARAFFNKADEPQASLDLHAMNVVFLSNKKERQDDYDEPVPF